MKVVSIDIETTGLDENKSQILEIGFVIFDTDEEFELTEMNHLRVVLCRETLIGNVFAFTMHPALLKEIKEVIAAEFSAPESDNYVITDLQAKKGYVQNTLYADFTDEIEMEGEYTGERDEEVASTIISFFEDNGIDITDEKITVVGKNYASFDAKFLVLEDSCLNSFLPKVRHRVMDVGNFFVRPGDDCIPDLKTCLERAGIEKEIDHTSIGDAVDVVKCVLYHFDQMRQFEKENVIKVLP